MHKEKIAIRIEELIKEYKAKKDGLDEIMKKFEKIQKNRKVKNYIELREIIANSKKELLAIIKEISVFQEKYKNV